MMEQICGTQVCRGTAEQWGWGCTCVEIPCSGHFWKCWHKRCHQVGTDIEIQGLDFYETPWLRPKWIGISFCLNKHRLAGKVFGWRTEQWNVLFWEAEAYETKLVLASHLPLHGMHVISDHFSLSFLQGVEGRNDARTWQFFKYLDRKTEQAKPWCFPIAENTFRIKF